MQSIDSLKLQLHTMVNLEDITNVLEQVAARDIAQMRQKILDSRPFFQEVWRVHRVLQQLSPPPPEVVHKHLVVAIAIDWGMPGDLMNRLLDKAEVLYDEHAADLLIVGKMGHPRFADRDERTIHFFSAPKKAAMADITPIYKIIAGYAKVSFVYPRFESLSKQNIVVSSSSIGDRSGMTADDGTSPIDAARFIIEPDTQSIANYMNEAVVGSMMYHYFAESLLAYSAAQMVAMRNAYDNAKDGTKHLRVRYHKARREIVDSKLRELYGSRAAVAAQEGGGQL